MSTLKIFHKKKILLVFLLCAAMLVGLVGRLGYLMLFQSEYYHKKATDLHERERDIKAARGRILDVNGTVLAGTHSKHGIQFVTWDRDYDRTDEALRWRNTGAAEKWDRKRQSFRRNPFLASFDYFIFRQRCVIL